MNENRVLDANDPLSAAMTKMQLRAYVNVALDAGGHWAIDFPAYEGFTLNVVQKGECWLCLAGVRAKVRLRAGDCFLLTGGKKFTLATNPLLKKRFRAEALFAQPQDGIATCNGGGDFFVLGIIFRFQGHLPALLFERLPPLIHVDGGSDHAAILRANLDRFSAEMRTDGIGRSLILSHLAPIMLVQILRLYLSASPRDQNWLTALAQPRIARVLHALQTDYQRSWNLEDLAEIANMSRSGFALTFRKQVGVPPMVYLTNWRMQIACELLQAGDQTLSSIAGLVGYGSESAFSVAFTKVLKRRPGAYRKPGVPSIEATEATKSRHRPR